ncbi:MAG: hypothetical protein ACTHK7_09790 [Aureliella sp.]
MSETFCIARVGELVERAGDCDIEFVSTELQDADSVIRFLQNTYDRFATYLADRNAECSEDERIDPLTLGGFGVQLTNRFGDEIEIGLGRRFCVLLRLKPQPTTMYRNPCQGDGFLVFYLDGWHYTEIPMSDLITRDECLSHLQSWLDAGIFPTDKCEMKTEHF